MTLTEGETRALLASAVLVLLSAVGRLLLTPAAAPIATSGLGSVGGIDSVLAVAESLSAESERRRRPLGVDERIDPNSADEGELDRLPGVGPALARAIVANRKENGPFRSLAELERVPGVGSSTLGRLAPHLTLRTAPDGPVASAEAQVGRSGDGASEPVDLNKATGGQLEQLPGIGPTRSAAIVRWREEHGPFRSWEDLLDVPGIGSATVARLKGRARLGS
ncbi:MAG: helix-hairpin-helix domain-containing protein [Gemmatimonadota bacterium]|nr:MAG: helix-hairpin-helix domain-containing protein [Gemmatimonadota bacterium]